MNKEYLKELVKQHTQALRETECIEGVVISIRFSNDKKYNLTKFETVNNHIKDLKRIIEDKIKEIDNQDKMYF